MSLSTVTSPPSHGELCGKGNCLAVELGNGRGSTGGTVDITKEYRSEPHRKLFGRGEWRMTTDLRILTVDGDEVAQGVAAVITPRECCASSTVRFRMPG